ncbi:hypothetical protein MTR67_023737 [Solanum verrucosum]|uniref:Uncharacterized protein n=1 Tax=Solanum verrucosum TaxID=315347 RepID=A0AAF0TRP7_SOLVR|nr:hypothetical protein MTR67_023737 [Solanum verrucosum]
MNFCPRALSVILISVESEVFNSSFVMTKERIAISYYDSDGVYIPSKVMNVEEEGDKGFKASNKVHLQNSSIFFKNLVLPVSKDEGSHGDRQWFSSAGHVQGVGSGRDIEAETTYQDKATQTDLDKDEKIFNAIAMLCTKIDNMDKELQQIKSQQHDGKHAELSRSEDLKIPELEGDARKHRKTQTNNLLHAATVYTQTGDEIAMIPELHKAFMNYKRITKGTLFYIKFYSAPAEILYDEIKPIIQVIKIGLTREMIIPEKIEEQEEIQKVEIPAFYAGKRIIGIATILNELTSNYLNNNSIWSYYSREQTMIYSNCREFRAADMEELRQWALSLLKPEQQPTTRAIRKDFISSEIMTRYCKTIGHKYPDHQCSKCQGEDNVIPDVQLE